MCKEKPLFDWISQNIYVNIEAERLVFADLEGVVSAEENLRFQALHVNVHWGRHSEVDLWLNSDEHAEALSDLPKIMHKIREEEAVEEAIHEEQYYH
jgi:hypothetical protein